MSTQVYKRAIDPPMTGDELDPTKLDSGVFFPAGIQQILSAWRVGFPITAIEDRAVQIVQGTGAGKSRVKLYFDRESVDVGQWAVEH